MKKKVWTNVITRWLERWFIQTQVENNGNTNLNVFSVRRPNRTPQEEQKRFKFAKFYVLLNLKHSLLSLWVTHPFLGDYPLHEHTIALWRNCSEKFWEIPRKTSVEIRSLCCISSNKHPRRLLNFETEWFLLEGGVYFKVSEISNIIIIKNFFQNKS